MNYYNCPICKSNSVQNDDLSATNYEGSMYECKDCGQQATKRIWEALIRSMNGWLLHPNAPGYFYKGQEVKTEAELKDE